MFQSGDQAERLDVQLKAVMGVDCRWQRGFCLDPGLRQEHPATARRGDPSLRAPESLWHRPHERRHAGHRRSGLQARRRGRGGAGHLAGPRPGLGQAEAAEEEILQLTERGVPVWQLLEQVTGKNTAELQRLSSAG